MRLEPRHFIPESAGAMLLIECPYCGRREQTEFAHGGEAHLARPPTDCDDKTWAAYLFLRDNPKGWRQERWRHAVGCGRWFNMLRNTASGATGPVYEIGATPPALADRDDQ